jgi:sugar phosphate permease
LGIGVALLIVADLIFAMSQTVALSLLAAVLWGTHLGLTQGLLAAALADSAPVAMRGTAFGAYHFVTGLGLIGANTVAGVIWTWYGSNITFLVSAVLAACALVGLIITSLGSLSARKTVT